MNTCVIQEIEDTIEKLSEQVKSLKDMPSLNKKKSKPNIKKFSPDSISIDGCILTIPYKKAGTDYYVIKNDNHYIITTDKCNKVIGGFHYGLIPETFCAVNNIPQKNAEKIRGINAYSIWTKKHRPSCEPEGMVFIKPLSVWIDIYLTGSNEVKGTSLASGYILGGDSNKKYGRVLPKDITKMKYVDFETIANNHSKRMLTENEFQVAMFGVKENCSTGNLDDGRIKHIKDFTSKYGIEQATGCQWIWSSEQHGDNTEHKKIFGGHLDHSSHSGSRASDWSNSVWYTPWGIGLRCACEHLNDAS